MYNILIVDDIFVNRLLIKEIVRKVTKTCHEAQNGKEAIQIITNEEIDVVLMDIEMPVMNGIETTQYIRNDFPIPTKRTIPIIALTAHNPISFFEDYKNVGFNQLMTKPYSIDKILKLIYEVCVKENNRV